MPKKSGVVHHSRFNIDLVVIGIKKVNVLLAKRVWTLLFRLPEPAASRLYWTRAGRVWVPWEY